MRATKSALVRAGGKFERIPFSGCWIWTASLNSHGYARLRSSVVGRTNLAHRLIYEEINGPVHDGLPLDHLCRVRCCVNPEHLEPVTLGDNLRRSSEVGKVIAELMRVKTHCPHGHPYSGANLYFRSNGARECKACDATYYQLKKRGRVERQLGV